MSTFHFDEGLVDIPAHWTDRSVNILMSSAGTKADFSLVVSREPLAGREFAAVIAEQLKEVSKRLPGHRLLGRRETTVSGVAAIEARSLFTLESGQMYQRMVAVPYYDKALLFTATTLFKDAESCDVAVERILESLMLRRREE
jgi:hypothetical protein